MTTWMKRFVRKKKLLKIAEETRSDIYEKEKAMFQTTMDALIRGVIEPMILLFL